MVSIPDCLEQISAVLQLLGHLDNVGAPPATDESIQELPVVNIQRSQVGELNSGRFFCLFLSSIFRTWTLFFECDNARALFW